MKTSSRFIAICALFGAGLIWMDLVSVVLSAPRPKPLSAPPIKPPATPANSFVANEVLVKFKPIRSAQDRMAVAGVRGHGVLKDLRRPGWSQVRIRPNETVDQALAAYKNDPDVEYAQPNYIYRAAAAPNDPHHGQLWALKNIGQTVAGDYLPNSGTAGADLNIEKAWDHITDCSNVVVAVIDTGVNYNHEDLAGNMWNGAPDFPLHGADFVDNDNDPMDLNGHGTRVAAIIGAAGNNATGATGVCWKASIMALRALNAGGVGTTAIVIQAIDFAVNHGAKVLNVSLGGGGFDQALSDALENARANDVVVVLAAGNGGNDLDAIRQDHHPCKFAHDNLLCVAALDQNYSLAGFSNFGRTSVDVSAPGTNILSASTGVWSKVTDDFNTGGVLDWTNSGGWAYLQPWLFSDAGASSADHPVYKNFDLRGKGAAILNFGSQIPLNGQVNVNFRNGGGDPFAGGILVSTFSGPSYDPCPGGGVFAECPEPPPEPAPSSFIDYSYDISACAGPICSVGFRSLTNPFWAGAVLIRDFSIDMLQLTNTTYETFNGTSVATAYVAGLAAMLRAYNPQYQYADVVSAIKNGGRPTEALQDKTSTGKAVDFMSSLAYINTPTGLRATVTR